jgi:hypothetical protein
MCGDKHNKNTITSASEIYQYFMDMQVAKYATVASCLFSKIVE